ncbi:MAG: hypothetical protein P8X81_01340 [Woeseiaceae bacterium]
MRRFAACVLLFCGILSWPAAASPLFDDDSVLDIRLSGPLRSVTRSRKHKEPQEYRFTLTVDETGLPVDVRVRGKSRKIVCSFPPLRLNFDEEGVAGTVFAGQDKLKLVTHCKSGNQKSETNLLDEYTAYRIFNVISDVGYRVRLLRVHYEDTDGKLRGLDEPYYAFLIETDSELASRLGGEVAKIEGVPYSKLNAAHTARFYVFQYLIGNFDWSFVIADDADTCCHNVDLLEKDGQLYPIAYDFDFSGLVNATYTRVPPSIGIKRATQRVFRGYCKLAIGQVAAGFDEIVARRDEIMSVVTNSPVVVGEDTGARVRYIGYFFEQALEKRDEILEEFDSDCLGPH